MRRSTVSVLLPCFQSRSFLARAVESVLDQSYGDLELVIVDNASTDGTEELARDYAAADSRIRFHRNEENIGPVRNWRRAAELARGEVAGLLFSDDWYEPGFLAEAVPELLDPRVGWVHSSVLLERPEREASVAYALPGPRRHATREYLRSALEDRGFAMPWSPGCAVMRREDLHRWLHCNLPHEDRFGFLNHGAGPDLLVYLQACLEYPEFVHLAEPQVHFLWHAGNLSKQAIVRQAYLEALEWFLESSRPEGVDRHRALAVSWLRSHRAGRPRPGLGLAGWWHLAGYAAARLRGRRSV